MSSPAGFDTDASATGDANNGQATGTTRVDDMGMAVQEEWQPTKHEKAIIYTLAILNLIVSLDATIIVTSLAVQSPSSKS
jgi:hypothetical protein